MSDQKEKIINERAAEELEKIYAQIDTHVNNGDHADHDNAQNAAVDVHHTGFSPNEKFYSFPRPEEVEEAKESFVGDKSVELV